MITNTYTPSTAAEPIETTTITMATITPTTVSLNAQQSFSQTQSIQQQPQPILQQPIFKQNSIPKLSKVKNLPTLSISGPSPPYDDDEIL